MSLVSCISKQDKDTSHDAFNLRFRTVLGGDVWTHPVSDQTGQWQTRSKAPGTESFSSGSCKELQFRSKPCSPSHLEKLQLVPASLLQRSPEFIPFSCVFFFSPFFSTSQVADRLPRSWREKARLLLPPCVDNPKKDRLTLDGQMLSSTFLGKKSFMRRRLQSQELERLAVSSLIQALH